MKKNDLYFLPSKTFIVGEYAALKKGPSLILCTQPYFCLHVTENTNLQAASLIGIPPNSPAGKLIKAYPDFYRRFQLKFDDPHQNIGGFGASSAQFLSLLQLKLQLKKINQEKITEVLRIYRQVGWDGCGFPPSGADVIAQWVGNICYFNPKNNSISAYLWKFTDIEFCLIHTGNKINTYEHLKSLNDFSIDEFVPLVELAKKSIQDSDSKNFIDAINEYADVLNKHHFVCTETQLLLDKIRKITGVMACKGCGTLGSDVILVILDRSQKNHFVQWASQQKLNVITIGKKLGTGLIKKTR